MTDPDPILPVLTSRNSLCGLSKDRIAEWLARHDHPAYRAEQLGQWIYRRRAESIDEMIDLPGPLRKQLAADFDLFSGTILRHQVARDRTEKLLVELADGKQVECVLMRESSRWTVCVSTQVGCAMGCVFCASGLLGLDRNLTASEILEQVLRLTRRLEPDERLTNIVVMGIGEPLANLEPLLEALEFVHADDGLGLSPRRITISTVGLPNGIRQLAEIGRPYNLAVSLHAPNDELRNRLVPVNNQIGIAAILEAADEYFQLTGRRVTYEYVLLAETNDQPRHARQLAALLGNRNAHVNLIPMNSVDVLPWNSPAAPQTERFATILDEAGIATTVRKRKGADIDAACGQLRLENSTT
ncbi:MAG: 23S rRNA (adenine(2503)-C(2))-methyltransferase RlmN [Planctomycetaceae bacterium]